MQWNLAIVTFYESGNLLANGLMPFDKVEEGSVLPAISFPLSQIGSSFSMSFEGGVRK
jgi:hypothetical protein